MKEQVQQSNIKLSQLTEIATNSLLIIVSVDLVSNNAELLDTKGNNVKYNYINGNWKINLGGN